jgi:hypothetical protein
MAANFLVVPASRNECARTAAPARNVKNVFHLAAGK